MSRRTNLPLFTGIFASATSSLCCMGPLILLAFGVGGSWVGNLAQFEPYRPIFIVLAIVSFVWAAKLVFLTESPADQETAAKNSASELQTKILFWCSVIVAAIFMTSIYWVPIIIAT